MTLPKLFAVVNGYYHIGYFFGLSHMTAQGLSFKPYASILFMLSG